MDVLTASQRKKNMTAIKGRNTKPELLVRRVLFARGYRFRIHCKYLPGNPDIVLKKYRTAVFVNGCFWHRHENCRYATTPASNAAFWQKKFRENVARDQRNYELLQEMGWNVVIIWECQLRLWDEYLLGENLERWLTNA